MAVSNDKFFKTNDEFERYWEEITKRDISYMGKEWNEEFERLSQKAAERRDRELRQLRQQYIKEVEEAHHAVEANEEIDQFVGLWEIAGLEYDVSWKHKNAKGKYVPRKYIARPTGGYGVIREYTKDELLKYGRKKTMADFEGLLWENISDKAKEFIRSKIPDIDLKMTENLQNQVEPPEKCVEGKDAPLTIEPFPEECPHPALRPAQERAKLNWIGFDRCVRKYIARPTGQYGVVKEYTSSELIKYGRKKTMADVQSPEELVAGKDAPPTIEPATEECPHPEWLGVWDFRGVGIVHVTWESYEGMYIMKHTEKGYEFSREYKWTPDPDYWTQIEPAPLESRAHTKPKQKLSIGWDPYDLG